MVKIGWLLASWRWSGWADSSSTEYDLSGLTLVNWIWSGRADIWLAGDNLDNPDILTLRWILASWMRCAQADWQLLECNLDALALGLLYGVALCWLDVICTGKLCAIWMLSWWAGNRLAAHNVNQRRADWISWVLWFRILFYRRGKQSRHQTQYV